MKRSLMLLLLAGVFTSCNAQTSQTQPETKTNKEITKSDKKDKDQPQVNVKVNKKYDKDGNLVGFDSTYVEYYSNIKGDTVMLDSLMNGFEPFMNEHYSGLLNRPFDPLFFTDSLMQYDFFNDDYFQKRYELNQQFYKDMFKEMDSVKRQYFKEFENIHKEEKGKEL